jgi:hypothetical protein
LSRSCHGSSKPSHHEVMRSQWRLGGPWLQLVARRVSRAAGPCSSVVTPRGRR